MIDKAGSGMLNYCNNNLSSIADGKVFDIITKSDRILEILEKEKQFKMKL